MGQDDKRYEKTAKPAAPAKLGREAKIGAMVILTLLLGLAIAVGVRFSRWGQEDKKPESVAKHDADRPHPPAPPKKDPLFGNDEFKFKPTGGNSVASNNAPSRYGESESHKRKHTADKAEPKRLDDLAGLSAPMPPPPPKAVGSETPKSPARYDPFAADASTVRNTGSSMASDRESNVLRSRSSAAGESASHETPRRNRYDDVVASSDSLPRDNFSAPSSSRNIPPAPPAAIPRYSAGEPSRSPYDAGSGYGDSNVVSRHGYGTSRRDDGKYEVQPNDNYSVISQKVYGTDGYFKALVEYNRSKGNGDEQLKPGALVSTPPIHELEKAYPDLCPKASRREASQGPTSFASTRGSYRSGGRTYTVTEGDTLFTIARYELGKASRWAEIYDLNRDALGKDYNYLRPGTRLVLPDGERGDSVARRPDDGYRK